MEKFPNLIGTFPCINIDVVFDCQFMKKLLNVLATLLATVLD